MSETPVTASTRGNSGENHAAALVRGCEKCGGDLSGVEFCPDGDCPHATSAAKIREATPKVAAATIIDFVKDVRGEPSAATECAATTFWLIRLHDGMISHHPYKTEAARDKWAAKYRARGDRVETEGVTIRA